MEDYGKRVEHFSGGWQMRIALARLLLQRPDMLLLDEPTNHLDLKAVEWLEGYLRQYKGALVVVSHDRYFLDRVTERTLELHRARLFEYPGSDSFYVREKARRQSEQEAAYRRQQEYLQRQQAFIDRFHADKRRSSLTKSREKLLEKIEKVEAPAPSPKTIKFRFPPCTSSGKKLFELKKRAGIRRVGFSCDLLIFGRRVALVRADSAGGITLLRLLAAVGAGSGFGLGGQTSDYYARTSEAEQGIPSEEVYSATGWTWKMSGMLGPSFSQAEVYSGCGAERRGARSSWRGQKCCGPPTCC